MGGKQHLDIAIVELVNETDEASRLILCGRREHGNTAHYHRMELTSQLNVVILTAWAVTDLPKLEPNHVLAPLSGKNAAAIHLQACITLGNAGTKFAKAPFKTRLVGGRSVYLRLTQHAQPEIHLPSDCHHIAMLLD